MTKVTTSDGVRSAWRSWRAAQNSRHRLLRHHAAALAAHGNLAADTRRWQDAILAAEAKKTIVSHGAVGARAAGAAAGAGQQVAGRGHDPR